MDETVNILMLALVIFVIVTETRRRRRHRRRVSDRHRKRKEFSMTSETIADFIGKICAITTEGDWGDWGSWNARVISVEDNWLKVERKDGLMVLNLDMVTSIRLLPANKQKASRAYSSAL